MKLGLTAKPFKDDVTITASYINSRIRNSVAGFPERPRRSNGVSRPLHPRRRWRSAAGRRAADQFRAAGPQRAALGITFTHRLKTSEALVEAMRNSRRAREMAERRAASQAARDAAGEAVQQNAGQGAGRGPGGSGAWRSRGFGGRGGQAGGCNSRCSTPGTSRMKVLIRRGLPVLRPAQGRYAVRAAAPPSMSSSAARLFEQWHRRADQRERRGGTTVTGSAVSPTGRRALLALYPRSTRGSSSSSRRFPR